jgi:hypothetical protein
MYFVFRKVRALTGSGKATGPCRRTGSPVHRGAPPRLSRQASGPSGPRPPASISISSWFGRPSGVPPQARQEGCGAGAWGVRAPQQLGLQLRAAAPWVAACMYLRRTHRVYRQRTGLIWHSAFDRPSHFADSRWSSTSHVALRVRCLQLPLQKPEGSQGGALCLLLVLKRERTCIRKRRCPSCTVCTSDICLCTSPPFGAGGDAPRMRRPPRLCAVHAPVKAATFLLPKYFPLLSRRLREDRLGKI